MIFFTDNSGTIIKTLPSSVYQGSAGANDIYLVAPFAEDLTVTVRFQLPNGVWTTPALMKNGTADKGVMTEQGNVNGVIEAATGATYAIWSYALPNEVTKYYGTVTAQFFFYAAKEGVFTASSSTGFTVGRGVPTVLPEGIEDGTILDQIYYNISSLQSDLKNGYYAARSFYAWNSTYTYGANEIVFYPQTGEFGELLKSLTDNNNTPPYTVGADGQKIFDSTNWQKVVDFNTLNDLYDLEEQAEQFAKDAEQSAKDAQGSASAASASAAEAQKSENSAKESADEAADTVKKVKEVIPSDATPENPLTTRNFVNSSINAMAAFYITSNAQGAAFSTRAALFSAATFYSGGAVRVPTQNDYAIVLADESQPVGVDGSRPTTRYSYQGGTYPNGQWDFQYVVNNTSLTQDQVNAINSGITAPLVQQISTNESDITDLKSTSEKNMYNLGAYDTYVSNGDGTGTVTRKTGYFKITNTTYLDRFSVNSGDRTVFVVNNSPTDGRFRAVSNSPFIFTTTDQTWNTAGMAVVSNIGTDEPRVDMCVAGDVTEADFKSQYLSEPILIQFEGDTEYTETVIENQPIHTLSQDGEQWLRDEWEKGLNVYNGPETVVSEANNQSWSWKTIRSIPVKENTNYYFACDTTDTIGDGSGCYIKISNSANGVSIIENPRTYKSFITPDGCTRIDISFAASRSAPITNVQTYTNIMLVKGTHPYPYQPYNGEIVHEKDLENYLPKSGGTVDGNLDVTGTLSRNGEAVPTFTYDPVSKTLTIT